MTIILIFRLTKLKHFIIICKVFKENTPLKETLICENDNFFDFKSDFIEVAKQIKDDRPFSTVAVFCLKNSAVAAINLCNNLKKIGNTPILLVLGENYKFSVQSVRDYFALPENVRATVVLSKTLLELAKYYSSVKDAPCYFIPMDGVPLGIYDRFGRIFDDGKLFKVELKKPKVFLIKSLVEKDFFKNATLTLIARVFLLKGARLNENARTMLMRAIKGMLFGDYESLIKYSFKTEQFADEGQFIKSVLSVSAYYAYGNFTPTETLVKAVIGEGKKLLSAENFIPENFSDSAREVSLLTGLTLSFTLNKAVKCISAPNESLIDKYLLAVVNKIFNVYEKEYGKCKRPTEKENAAARLALNNFNIFV